MPPPNTRGGGCGLHPYPAPEDRPRVRATPRSDRCEPEPVSHDGRGPVRVSRWRERDVLDGLPCSAVPGARPLSGRRCLRALPRGRGLVPASGVAVARPADDDPDAACLWRRGVGHLHPAPLAAVRRPTGRATATGHLLWEGAVVKWGRPQGMHARPADLNPQAQIGPRRSGPRWGRSPIVPFTRRIHCASRPVVVAYKA